MVLPEQAERKTASTFPAGNILPVKTTPAEITVLLTAIHHSHFLPAQHIQVMISDQCLHPHVRPNTLSLHSLPAPTMVRKHMTIQSLMLALIYLDGAQSDKATAAAVPACVGR